MKNLFRSENELIAVSIGNNKSLMKNNSLLKTCAALFPEIFRRLPGYFTAPHFSYGT